jgi:hypothetical protein
MSNSDIPLLASSLTLARNYKSKPVPSSKAVAPQLTAKSRVAAAFSSNRSGSGSGPAGLPLDATRGAVTSTRLVSCYEEKIDIIQFVSKTNQVYFSLFFLFLFFSFPFSLLHIFCSVLHNLLLN